MIMKTYEIFDINRPLMDANVLTCGILIKYLDNKKNSCTFVNLNLG